MSHGLLWVEGVAMLRSERGRIGLRIGLKIGLRLLAVGATTAVFMAKAAENRSIRLATGAPPAHDAANGPEVHAWAPGGDQRSYDPYFTEQP